MLRKWKEKLIKRCKDLLPKKRIAEFFSTVKSCYCLTNKV